MYDARIFPPSLETFRNKLLEKGAALKGDYVIHDTIYASKNPEEGLEKVFLRLREVPKNIWNEKRAIVAIKNTNVMEVGKQSAIPVKEQFDTREEALKFITDTYLGLFDYEYEFQRSGEQWFLGEDVVDLETIEGGYSSIEFKSKTAEGLKKLLDLSEVSEQEVIQGPSVVAVKYLLAKPPIENIHNPLSEN